MVAAHGRGPFPQGPGYHGGDLGCEPVRHDGDVKPSPAQTEGARQAADPRADDEYASSNALPWMDHSTIAAILGWVCTDLAQTRAFAPLNILYSRRVEIRNQRIKSGAADEEEVAEIMSRLLE